MDHWYVAPPGGNTEGPYTTEDLIVKIRRGLVDRDGQVCNANGSVWVAMADVPEFERALRRAPTILKAPGAFQPSKPPPAQSSPKAAAQPAAASRPRLPKPPPAPIRTKVSQPPAGADRAKVSHPPVGLVRSRVSESPAEPHGTKLTDPPEPSKLTDPPEPSTLTDPPQVAAPVPAAAPLPAMPPLGPPRRDEGEDTIPPPATQPAPEVAPTPEPAVPPAFEIAPEPTAGVAATAPQDSSLTDETVPGRGRRAQPVPPLPWMVTGVGIFVLLTGAIVTLAANSLKGTVIMLLGLGAISVGGQLGSGWGKRS